MKLYADKLQAHIKKPLLPIYLVTGDETLLVGEACDVLRRAARDAGFATREVMFAERGFDYSQLAQAGASMSLFAERQILELRMPTGKPGREGSKAICEYAAEPPEETLLIIIAPKLERRVHNSAWVKAINKVGGVLQLWPVPLQALPRWISARAQAAQMTLSREGAALLAERVEGNLLAAAQEVDKLRLLNGPGAVDLDAVQEAVSASARYDVFGFVDCAVAGQGARALTMLRGLQGEGVAPALILWALVREIRTLAEISFDVACGQSFNHAVANKHIWAKKQPAVKNALRRLGRRASQTLLLHAGTADRIIKGARHDDTWAALTQLTAMLSGIEPVTQQPLLGVQ